MIPTANPWFRAVPALAAGMLLTGLLVGLLAGCETRLGDVRAAGPPPPRGDGLAIIARHGMAPETVGYAVYDAETGARVAAKSENTPFIPASVAKVPTTVAALEILGPDFRFRTPLLITGKVEDGTLDGTLYLKGGGDPMLSPADLMSLARKLRAAGIRRLNGGFYVDTSLIAGGAEIEPRQPDDAGYNPGFGALSLDFNRILMTWAPGPDETRVFAASPTGPGDVSLAPPSTPPGPNFVYRGRGEAWLLSPRAPGAGAEWLPVKQPGLYAGQVFRQLARMNGTALPPPGRGAAPTDAREIARHTGEPLIRTVRAGLEFSNNLVAEMIGLAASRRLTGRKLTLKESSARLTAWLKERIPGISWRGYVLDNHSGLSSGSRATPRQMVSVLRYAEARRDYHALLGASGWKESLGGRLADASAALRVWAKTGTLKYASGIAGTLFTAKNRRLVFALFITDMEKRRRYDRTANQAAPGVAAPAEAWLERAKALEEALIRRWIAVY